MKNATQTTKPAAKVATKPAPTSTASVLAVANSAPPVSSAAQPIKKPAVVYVAGVAAGAPANAPVVALGGTAYNGALPATNPANRGVVGTVKNGAALLTVGNGKSPTRAGHNQTMFAAIAAHLQANKGQASGQALANAAGAGGAAFVGYCLKMGWLAPV